MGSSSIFGGVRVAQPFIYMCGAEFCFCVICLRPVFFMPNVVSVSGLSIIDFPLRFSQRLF